MKESNNLFVGLKDPKEARRNLLESSKSVVASMQVYQKVIGIRAEKEGLKKKLKEDVKELKILLSHLEKLLPDKLFDVRKETPKKEKLTSLGNDPAKKELDRLHEQLSMIEKKLKKLE